MSRPPILIKDLVKGNQVWKMLIRVVDLWIVKEKNGLHHFEMVIQDSKGDQIHVTTRNRDFKEWSEQLTEHETYCLHNGEPMPNDGAFKVCPNEFKLVFNGGTTISKMAIPEIPPHQYKFKPIVDFLTGNFVTDLLYDVIGVLQDVVKTQMGGGGKKSCANITLRDEVGNIIEVALWDDYGKQLMSYNTSNNSTGPTLIVLTHAWCKQNQASGLPSLSNAWNGSRLHINLNHPQVHDFKSKLGSTLSATAPTHSITQTSESFVQSGNKSWTNSNEVKSIHHICQLGKDCFATTIGTTKRFKASKHGWYFEACPSCKTSNKSTGAKFVCVCGVKDIEPVTKYKIEVEVEFDNHVGCFVFWDKDVIPYVNVTARELRQIMKEAGEDNPKIYPVHLDKLLDKELAFRIKYQSFFDQFSIVTILNDPGVYKTLSEVLKPDEHTSKAALLETDAENAMDVQHEPIPTQSSEQNFTAHLGIEPNQTCSPSTCSSNTPAKRGVIPTCLDDFLQEDVLTPKQSATKVKHLKKE